MAIYGALVLLWAVFLTASAGDISKKGGEEEKKPSHPKIHAFTKEAHLRPTKCQGSVIWDLKNSELPISLYVSYNLSGSG